MGSAKLRKTVFDVFSGEAPEKDKYPLQNSFSQNQKKFVRFSITIFLFEQLF